MTFGTAFVLGPAIGGYLGEVDLRLPFWGVGRGLPGKCRLQLVRAPRIVAAGSELPRLLEGVSNSLRSLRLDGLSVFSGMFAGYANALESSRSGHRCEPTADLGELADQPVRFQWIAEPRLRPSPGEATPDDGGRDGLAVEVEQRQLATRLGEPAAQVEQFRKCRKIGFQLIVV